MSLIGATGNERDGKAGKYAWKIKCPVCCATVGANCRNKTGEASTSIHMARRIAAEKAGLNKRLAKPPV